MVGGLRVLVVEDEPLIGLDIAQTLNEAGATVIGPATSSRQALDLIRIEPLDAAVLDYRLGRRGDTASRIVETLEAARVPYLFNTSSRVEVEALYPGVTVLPKPTLPSVLVQAVGRLVGRS